MSSQGCRYHEILDTMLIMNYSPMKTFITSAIITSSIALAPFAFAASQPITHTKHLSVKTPTVQHTSTRKTFTETSRKGFGGNVTAITGTTITLSDGKTTYSVDTSKAMIRVEGQKTQALITDIHIGDTLVALGTANGTTISAKMIIVRPVTMPTSKAFTTIHKTKTAH